MVWHMHFACWMTEATDTLRICNTYCFCTATVVTWAHLRCYVILMLPVLSFFLMHVNLLKKCLFILF